jgi:hypothetical protein
MRRLILYIAMSLSLISLSSAQQQNNNPPTGTCPAGLCFIQNTNGLQYTQHGASFNVDGSGTAGGTLSANVVNSNTNFQIGGGSVLSIGLATDGTLFVGPGAGASNVQGQGQGNTFAGSQAGYKNTNGNSNSFFGGQAGYNNTASENSFFGDQAGINNTTGGGNTFVGTGAGYSNTEGNYNTFTGLAAGAGNGTGSSNTFLGFAAGQSNNAGNYNIMLGFNAGYYSNSGNNNIYIGNSDGLSSESSTIRIGGDVGSGYGAQTAAYMAGIYGVNVGGVPVQINGNGQLGASTSSRRFKDQIRDMGDSTDALMKLRPVTFLYKPEYANGDRTLQYGLIAEEVAEVYPDLVAYDKNNQPFTVRYQYLASMLLNEFQKQHHREEEQAKVIESQKQEIEGLRQQLQLQNASMQMRLSKLESMVERQTTVAEK